MRNHQSDRLYSLCSRNVYYDARVELKTLKAILLTIVALVIFIPLIVLAIFTTLLVYASIVWFAMR